MRNSLYYIPMNSVIIKHIGEGVVAATLLCGISSVFANDTDSRLQAYKANRLIPQEFILKNSDSNTDLVFSASSLSWNTASNALQEKINSLGQAFAGMTASEVLAQIPNLDNGQDAFDYLAAIANGDLTSDACTKEAAIAEMEKTLGIYQALMGFEGCSFLTGQDTTTGEYMFIREGLDYYKINCPDLFAYNPESKTWALKYSIDASSLKNVGSVNLDDFVDFNAALEYSKFKLLDNLSNTKMDVPMFKDGSVGIDLWYALGCGNTYVDDRNSASWNALRQLGTTVTSKDDAFFSKALDGQDLSRVKGMSPSQALSAVTVGSCEKLPLIDLSKESDLNTFGYLFGYNKGPLNVTRAQFDAYKDYITGAKKWDLPDDIAGPNRSTITQIYVDGVLMDL